MGYGASLAAEGRRQYLLDAAHILPGGHPKGEPIVPNGLALCKLRHGLQGFDGLRIHAPDSAVLRPAEDFLAERFELFRRAG